MSTGSAEAAERPEGHEPRTYGTSGTMSDPVNHLSHYKSASGLESITVIEAFNLNFNLGNVVKYVLRSDKKGNRKQDLQKAAWFLAREIERMP